MHLRTCARFLLACAVVATLSARSASALNTLFTYQGQLRQNGAPVNNPCDVQFTLFDADSNGNQIGNKQAFDGLPIANGLFTVQLDFGSAFDGSDRWLETISRCPAGGGDFATLAPRQLITAAPYALGLVLPARATTALGGNALRITSSGDDGTAVLGDANGANGVALHGRANSGADAKAVLGQSIDGYAGYFDGRVYVNSADGSIPNAFVVAVNLSNVVRIDSTGKGFFNNGTQQGGADVAEFVATVDEPGPGDVVDIDAAHPGHFRRSAAPNSSAVAGVISTDPGVSLNARAGATAAVTGPQLALVGRVPVKVTAANGPIQPGDLLVTSGVPGHAMRSPEYPMPGTVLGKALTGHANGEGVIEMLVMLR